ncbi:SH3 domain-containing protein [Leisingera aquaemixtae]|uniref:SH3 domain-containing protein n=1 Tax=Leisingera aquaemixtae TaxID=1396826 RepID=UPI0021A45681|nr:SH3 domain-containing protein [Leisingera aquaemixtae]UWQ24782.1 SH3 domain-containing protein [Leisingera aquaemixtae]UWQ45678.1 SH3 domain-containing protein [Leisingera aquaemixtae]
MRATRRCAAAGLLWLAAAVLPAAAQEFPALYSVAGVSADDVLNIRSAPSASAEIIGTLAPDQAGVEVVAADGSGTWGLVNSGERSGWAALRFLTQDPRDDWRKRQKQALNCFGTEPFWSLALDETPNLTTPGGPEMPFVLLAREPGSNHSGKSGFHAVRQGDGNVSHTEPVALSGTLTAQQCSDGMSDRTYGISIDLLQLRGAGQLDVLTGCCSLVP